VAEDDHDQDFVHSSERTQTTVSELAGPSVVLFVAQGESVWAHQSKRPICRVDRSAHVSGMQAQQFKVHVKIY
jgi:hypothetical protein